MTKFQKTIIKYIKIFVIGMLSVWAVAVGLWGYVAISGALMSQKLTNAQIETQNALTSQVGKPTRVEYIYPNIK